MITKYEKANKGKLLVAVLALFVVLAGAAVVFSDSEVSAFTSPDTDTSGGVVGTHTLADDADLTELAGNDRVITIGASGATFNLTGNIGADEPVNVAFILNGTLTIQSQSNSTIYSLNVIAENIVIQEFDAPCTYTVTFNADNSKLQIQSANVTLDVNNTTEGSNTSVFNNMYSTSGSGMSGEVSVGNNATLTVNHAGSGSTWLGAPEQKMAKLTVTGTSTKDAVVNFNGTHAIQEVQVDADYAEINFNDVLIGMSVSANSDFNNSSVNVNGADLNGLFFKGDVSINNTTIDINNASRTNPDRPGLMISNQSEGTAITMDNNSSIDAETIGVTDGYNGYSSASYGVDISGGKITGDFLPAKTNATTVATTQPAYDLTNVEFVGDSQISESAKVTGTFTVGQDASLSVSGDVSGADITNNGRIAVTSTNAKLPATVSGDGDIDTSAISADATLHGLIYSITSYTTGQVITVDQDTTLLEGTLLTFYGTLIINEGVTLTIDDGAELVMSGAAAKLTNNGTIVVESDVVKDTTTSINTGGQSATGTFLGGGLHIVGATVDNNGSIDAMYSLTGNEENSQNVIVITEGATVNNNGTITIYDDNVITVEKVTSVGGRIVNNEGATVNLNGTASVNSGASFIYNAGTVNIDGAIITGGENGGRSIANTADGATVNIISLSGANSLIQITDSGLTYDDEVLDGTNTVQVSTPNVETASIVGLVITTVITSDDDGDYKSMDVSGAIAYADDDENSGAEGTVTIQGPALTVSGELSFSDDVTFTFGTGTNKLTVAGTVTVTEEATISGTGTIDVTGTIVKSRSAFPTTSLTINAAMYYTTEGANRTYYYTTLANAVESGATAVTVTGAITVLEDVTIPSGTTVTQQGNINIGNEDNTNVTVTVADGGKITQRSGNIAVAGTLYVENKNNGINRNPVVTSEVKSEGETDVRYTNLANAIAAAGSEDVTITLNGAVNITTNLTIPENVTVDTENKNFGVTGATLTIDGTLFLDRTTLTVADRYNDDNTVVLSEGNVVLNGYIKSNQTLAYSENGVLPAGAYYSARENNTTYNYITTVENSPNVINNATRATVNIYGENAVGDIAYTGTADAPVTVNVYGELNAGTITLQYATFAIINQSINGTIATAEGSIALTDAAVNATFTSASVDNDMTFTVTGSITAADSKTYKSVYGGSVYVSAFSTAGMTVDGTVTATGVNSSLGNVLVNGTLVADNESSFTAGEITVLGTVTANAATEREGAGSITASTLYIGLSKDDVVRGTSSSTGVAATVSGTVSAPLAYIADGCTVTDSIVDVAGVKHTAFYVDDVLWMTVYSTGTAANVTNAPIVNGIFNGWNDEDGEVAYNTSAASNITVGQYENLYADAKYDIYTVNVLVDNGIGSVAIDGQVMIKATGNGFTLSGLTAGEHQITYQLKSGYEGAVTMSVDGTPASGLTFTLSGEPDNNESTVEVNISLTGTTPVDYSQAGSSSDDGMGIVEILLIILVVVVVILAIIVVLRMMRS